MIQGLVKKYLEKRKIPLGLFLQEEIVIFLKALLKML